MAGRRVRIHRSLVKEQQLFGCDRVLFLSAFMLGTMLVVPAGLFVGSVVNALLGVSLFIVAVVGLSVMGKRDAQMRQVYLRSLQYRGRYVAAGRWDRPQRELRSWR